MAIIYMQLPAALTKELVSALVLYLYLFSVFYCDKHIGYKPGVLTRSVLSRQASLFSCIYREQS